jgi:hypothetical protein
MHTRVFLPGPLRCNERLTLLLLESASDAVSVSLPDLCLHVPQLIQTSVGQGALGGLNTVGRAPDGNPLNQLPALAGDLASDFPGVEKAFVPTTFTGAQQHSASPARHSLFRPTGTDSRAPPHRLHFAMFDLCRQLPKVRFQSDFGQANRQNHREVEVAKMTRNQLNSKCFLGGAGRDRTDE